ncbi:MAG TPA: hypothetical protein VGN75_14585 [Kaistia sp.]|nr:hypothetical protein [Kaistia sp.]
MAAGGLPGARPADLGAHRRLHAGGRYRPGRAEPEARCLADGVDLALPLLAYGLARTTPAAPPTYRRVEGLAGVLGRGIWDDQAHWPPWR